MRKCIQSQNLIFLLFLFFILLISFTVRAKFDPNVIVETDTEAWKKHHKQLNESQYGTYLGTRPVEKAEPYRAAPCTIRARDGKYVCPPDVYYIGTSKSGTTSIAHYLQQHPLVKNVISTAASEARHSKEGHYWEHISTDSENMTAYTTNLTKDWIEAALQQLLDNEEGYADPNTRPVLIEYTPNYFVLDHVPQLLLNEYESKYKIKFIVSLREPIGRTISSWKFKTRESFKRSTGRDPFFNKSMLYGMNQGKCVMNCYHKHLSMKTCSIQECRKKHDWRPDGRAGGYSYCAHVVKSMYAYQFLMWFQYFPRDRFFIFTIEEFEANPIGVLERLLDFLGLPLYDPTGISGYKDKSVLHELLAYVRNETPHTYIIDSQIHNKTIEDLKAFFHKPNSMLPGILGFDPGYNR